MGKVRINCKPRANNRLFRGEKRRRGEGNRLTIPGSGDLLFRRANGAFAAPV